MTFLFGIILFVSAAAVIVRQAKFGKLPAGERLKRMKNSPNYRNGAFRNLNHTPLMTGKNGYFSAAKAFLFEKSRRSKPSSSIPSAKIDLHSLRRNDDVLVWFGHSSYFLQVDGKRFLVDPVLSGHASPFPFTTPSHPGSDRYTPDDIPAIDYLLLTHDHWDHLDYEAITALQPKIGTIVTGLGNGEHLEHWGFSKEKIIEKDWNESVQLDLSTTLTLTPARHFSGRLFKRNQVLWTSFVLQSANKKIFIGGDSGYDAQFKMIGDQYGPFDLVILECGQYNERWSAIHMMPEQTVRAAADLRGAVLFPVHWGKFILSLHAWDEPINRALQEAERTSVPVIHPMIGEQVQLNNLRRYNNRWWTTVK
ncbi:MAG: MBL fold metallo-hydrolase [Bacteroidota bacterium]